MLLYTYGECRVGLEKQILHISYKGEKSRDREKTYRKGKEIKRKGVRIKIDKIR